MKKVSMFIALLLILAFAGCANSKYPDEIKVAYDYAHPKSKKTIRNWRNALVEEYTPNQDLIVFDEVGKKQVNIKGMDTFKVTFHTRDDEIIGPIIVFLTKKIRLAA